MILLPSCKLLRTLVLEHVEVCTPGVDSHIPLGAPLCVEKDGPTPTSLFACLVGTPKSWICRESTTKKLLDCSPKYHLRHRDIREYLHIGHLACLINNRIFKPHQSHRFWLCSSLWPQGHSVMETRSRAMAKGNGTAKRLIWFPLVILVTRPWSSPWTSIWLHSEWMNKQTNGLC